jgi:hypothetical protein
VFLCAFGIYRKSRVAAVLIFVYFIVAKVILAVETQSYNGIFLALVFLYFYGKAIQGSFVYHKLEKAENPDYKATSKSTYVVGTLIVLIVTVLLGFALMSTIGVIPSTRVLSGSEVNPDDIATLRSQGIVSSEQNVDYLYTYGMSSILESGNILTQEHVIVYFTDEEEGLLIYEIPIYEITDVELETPGDAFSDSVYVVHTNDPEKWLKLYLSREQKGDQKFVKALRERVGNVGQN